MPSTAANSGSLPLVAVQRSRTLRTDNDMPSDGWWHVTQARPFVPMGSKNGCPFVSSGPDVFRTPNSPWSLSYVANSGNGVPCPGLHHDVDDPGPAATKTAESHTARTVDSHLVIGPLLLCGSKMGPLLKNRSNLAVVKTPPAYDSRRLPFLQNLTG